MQGGGDRQTAGMAVDEPLAGEQVEQVVRLQAEIRRLRSGLDEMPPDSAGYEDAVLGVLRATDALITHEDEAVMRQARARARGQARAVLRVAGGVAAAGLLVAVAAVAGWVPTWRVLIGALLLALAAAMVLVARQPPPTGSDRRVPAVAAAAALAAVAVSAALGWPSPWLSLLVLVAGAVLVPVLPAGVGDALGRRRPRGPGR